MICSFNVTFWTSIDYIRLIIIDHLKIYEIVKITIHNHIYFYINFDSIFSDLFFKKGKQQAFKAFKATKWNSSAIEINISGFCCKVRDKNFYTWKEFTTITWEIQIRSLYKESSKIQVPVSIIPEMWKVRLALALFK